MRRGQHANNPVNLIVNVVLKPRLNPVRAHKRVAHVQTKRFSGAAAEHRLEVGAKKATPRHLKRRGLALAWAQRQQRVARADQTRATDVIAHRQRHGQRDARVDLKRLVNGVIDVANRQPLQKQRVQHQLLAAAFRADHQRSKGVAGADDSLTRTVSQCKSDHRQSDRQRDDQRRHQRLQRAAQDVSPGEKKVVRHEAISRCPARR